ncbi:MAG: hypothetical protein WCO54_03965 [Bacteroidota bacterium]
MKHNISIIYKILVNTKAIFISSILISLLYACKKDNTTIQNNNMNTPPLRFDRLDVTLWNSYDNKPYFNISPDTSIKLYHYPISFNPIKVFDKLIQIKDTSKYVNILDLSSTNNSLLMHYYLQISNNDVDTIFVEYVEKPNHIMDYYVKTFLYNNISQKKDSVTGVYVVNK